MMNLGSLKRELLGYKEGFYLDLANKNELKELDEIKVKYFGKKGLFNSIVQQLSLLSAEEKAHFGSEYNTVKNELYSVLEDKISTAKDEMLLSSSERIDVTLPGRLLPKGSMHPVSQVITKIKDIFSKMGFEVIDGPEIESVYFNFDALNAPLNHPSRELSDTFYLDKNTILRTQTTNVQARTIVNRKPPIMMISYGKAYRSDYDLTHTPMFHQMEGLFLDKKVSLANLKAIMNDFAIALFGPETKTRFRPHFFPFTEPSAEVDVSCVICHGKGCRVCKNSGWLEILGSGMVSPYVLEKAGYNAEEYSGFAFGMGIERVTMLLYGIDDLRSFYINDLRFLKQF